MPTLQFKGKTFEQNHHLAVKYLQFMPKKELSLTDNKAIAKSIVALIY
jgi:adenine-specific DNA-methyltransferase